MLKTNQNFFFLLLITSGLHQCQNLINSRHLHRPLGNAREGRALVSCGGGPGGAGGPGACSGLGAGGAGATAASVKMNEPLPRPHCRPAPLHPHQCLRWSLSGLADGAQDGSWYWVPPPLSGRVDSPERQLAVVGSGDSSGFSARNSVSPGGSWLGS